MERCAWAKTKEEIEYHDNHWCRVKHEDTELFEMLILEGKQAGLSWRLILERWPYIKAACDNFDYHKIALYDQNKIEELLNNPHMIRNKLKINALITNANAFIKVQEEFGSFDKYIWQFVNNKPIINHWQDLKEVPASNDLSDKISKDLKKRGFKFVGSTIIYSYMQAIGMINDHLVSCPFFEKCNE